MRALNGAHGPGGPRRFPNDVHSDTIWSSLVTQWIVDLIIAGEQHLNTTTVASYRFLKFDRVREADGKSKTSGSRERLC
jgi:hypothetical protein